MINKEVKNFFGVEVERYCITKLPAFFKYDNKRWDYAIKSTPEHADVFAKKLQSTGIFRTLYLKESGIWIVKEIRH
jgi:hypothetical protein